MLIAERWESFSVCNFNTCRYAHDSVFPSRSRSPVGRSKQVLRTYFPNSYSPPPLFLSLGGVMDHHAWHVVLRRYGKRPRWRFARYILLDTSSASLPVSTINAEERRECCALPRIIVYQHAVCAANLITWWMLTYSLMPILHTTHRPQSPVLLSLFYHHALSSPRDDVRQYRISFTSSVGMIKMPLLCLWFDLTEEYVRSTIS